MSFFKEFKEDLSQAVNELLPEEDLSDSDVKLKDGEELLEDSDENIDLDDFDNLLKTVSITDENTTPLDMEILDETEDDDEIIQAEITPDTERKPIIEETLAEPENVSLSDESAVITKGTKIKGDIESTGSLDIVGVVTGNVSCSGKLTITGNVTGNSKASEIFADAAKIDGEIISEGTVKVGVGSIVIGNITATSAVIAGAVNGDIDVKGPVVVDSSAVIMGDIKSRSVQINNGAVIEGFCSQCYSEVNVKAFFEEKK